MPVIVDVVPGAEPGTSIAYGPGLEKGVTDKHETQFTIEARDPKGNKRTEGGDKFNVKIDGPKGDVPSTVKDNKDGTYTVKYSPKDAGKHTVNVTLDSKPIKDMPVIVDVVPGAEPGTSIAYGPGLEKGVKDNEPTHFTIESRDKNNNKITHGNDKFNVKIDGPKGNVPAKIKDNGDGTYKVEYSPEHPGLHTINVTLEDKPIKDSPFKVDVVPGADPSKSIAYGDGLEHVLDTEPAEFKIEARDKRNNPIGHGGDKFDVKIKGPKGDVPATVKDNGDGTYSVKYAPKDHGKHVIDVKLKDQSIKDMPVTIDVEQGCDNENTSIDEFQFIIQARTKDGQNKATGGDKFTATIKCPNGEEIKADSKELKKGGGKYRVTYKLPEPVGGKYLINCRINNRDIRGSPFSQEL